MTQSISKKTPKKVDFFRLGKNQVHNEIEGDKAKHYTVESLKSKECAFGKVIFILYGDKT